MDDSPLQRLARLSLHQDPGEWTARRRADRYTWQEIADELGAVIGRDISRETVRLWATPHLEALTTEARS